MVVDAVVLGEAWCVCVLCVYVMKGGRGGD